MSRQTVGYPVVLKTTVRDIHHKVDVAGVRLGLADGGGVARRTPTSQTGWDPRCSSSSRSRTGSRSR